MLGPTNAGSSLASMQKNSMELHKHTRSMVRGRLYGAPGTFRLMGIVALVRGVVLMFLKDREELMSLLLSIPSLCVPLHELLRFLAIASNKYICLILRLPKKGFGSKAREVRTRDRCVNLI